MSSALYIYASKFFKKGGFLVVIIFFIGMYYYLNYQYCPFMFAFSILLFLCLLDNRQRNPGSILVMVILFVTFSIMHAFVPVFFILYLFMRSIIDKDKHHKLLLLICSVIYLLFETTYAEGGFFGNIYIISRLPTELTTAVPLTLKPVIAPLDTIAQSFSTVVLIMVVAVSVAGFLVILFKRKLRNMDKALFFTGIIYTIPGVFIYILSYRAIPLAFLPICLGVPFIFQTRAKSILIGVLLILLILFTFIPIHLAFYQQEISYQTKEGYNADNFLINHYPASKNSFVLASFFTRDYLQNRAPEPINVTVRGEQINQVDIILENLALRNAFNSTDETILDGFQASTLYDNGYSQILLRSPPLK